jgi:hypothetical protein
VIIIFIGFINIVNYNKNKNEVNKTQANSSIPGFKNLNEYIVFSKVEFANLALTLKVTRC